MSKKPANDGKPWTADQVGKIAKLVNQNKSTAEIAKNLGRTETAIRTQASKNNISLIPKNR